MGAFDQVDNGPQVVKEDLEKKTLLKQPDERQKGVKKRFAEETEAVVKRLRSNGLNPSSQTPLALLNELRSGLNFKIIQADGPPHCPNFLASVEVDGIVFNGSGNSKKLAKQRAAEAALLTLCPTLLNVAQMPLENIDFTLDSPVTPSTLTVAKDKNRQAFGEKMSRVAMLVNKSICGNLNAVMALNELFPGSKFDCVQQNSAKFFAPFVYTVTINNEVFKGSGNSKKMAKIAAAKVVLLSKYGHLLQDNSVMLTPPSGHTVPIANTFQPIAANQIAELVMKKYHEVMKEHPEFVRRKVLAAVVMTTTDDFSGGMVISIGTGTKCISGDHISVKGAVLNDSHAEIISRRGLMRFLYNQLALLNTSPAAAKESIFFYDNLANIYKLKDGIKFHLYISTSPCGDARIFSPHDIEGAFDQVQDRHPNRQSRGQLRTKIESGEGTIPAKSFDSIQTWDGVMQGERLLTMSCSDKLGKWNVVGVQGSLLSHFIEPIYLHSVVIGSLFHPTHLRRAMFSRLENTLEGLPPPFRLNHILMNTTTSPETRQTGKAPNHSVNWIIGEGGVEVVNAISGKVNTGTASRLCKQRMFGKFVGLLDRGIKSRNDITIKNAPQFYADVKAAAVNYQEAKSKMVNAFLKAGLGVWMKKPIEQDQFAIDVAL